MARRVDDVNARRVPMVFHADKREERIEIIVGEKRMFRVCRNFTKATTLFSSLVIE